MTHDHSHMMHHLFPVVDRLDVATMVAVSWYSFLMSWHCLAMCGPLVCAKFGIGDGSNLSNSKSSVKLPTTPFPALRPLARRIFDVGIYNCGRIVAYAAAGVLVGSLSSRVGAWSSQASVILAAALGVLFAIQGFSLMLNRESFWLPRFADRAVAMVLSCSNKMTTKILAVFVGSSTSGSASFLFGVVTVLLPCMTLAMALTAAASTNDPVLGAWVMVAFVIGTLPAMFMGPVMAMVGASMTANRLGFELPTAVSVRRLRFAAGFFLVVAGVVTILRIFH